MEINLFHLHKRVGAGGGSDRVITRLTSRSHTFDRGLVLSWHAASLQQGGVKQIKSSVWGWLRTKTTVFKSSATFQKERVKRHKDGSSYTLSARPFICSPLLFIRILDYRMWKGWWKMAKFEKVSPNCRPPPSSPPKKFLHSLEVVLLRIARKSKCANWEI